MPVFISYSHQDKDFVDQLAVQLVQKNVHVWVDRWELSVGDSLIDKVQQAVEGASALLVVLSPESVQSEWCKRELSAGLLRELEEKRVVVMPVLLRDCDIPIFARGKFYADFRTNFDEGLKAVVDGIAKVTNASLSRVQEDTYHVDWSISSGLDDNGNVAIKATFIQIPKYEPYTCLTEVVIIGDDAASQEFKEIAAADNAEIAKLRVWEQFAESIEENGELKALLEDAEEKRFRIPLAFGAGVMVGFISSRRLGEDTGKDVLLNVAGVVNESRDHMQNVLSKPAGRG
ncbi:toll/interleukin-1 receptor domain-containing protein [Stenotrophomonas maltophilia]|uniref:toll/interleukin-1 receptor domain-containing protein n=1 Tax=Stenotrophomonas maltophilia TaxID=40324 RepID=UPI00069DABFC|nr:toll/interleukin-1 receptor domain-containing protein [Stenotrophomonas maltophilia]